jgi:hypothetical protein
MSDWTVILHLVIVLLGNSDVRRTILAGRWWTMNHWRMGLGDPLGRPHRTGQLHWMREAPGEHDAPTVKEGLTTEDQDTVNDYRSPTPHGSTEGIAAGGAIVREVAPFHRRLSGVDLRAISNRTAEAPNRQKVGRSMEELDPDTLSLGSPKEPSILPQPPT